VAILHACSFSSPNDHVLFDGLFCQPTQGRDDAVETLLRSTDRQYEKTSDNARAEPVRNLKGSRGEPRLVLEIVAFAANMSC
jgi:hypothetical protein